MKRKSAVSALSATRNNKNIKLDKDESSLVEESSTVKTNNQIVQEQSEIADNIKVDHIVQSQSDDDFDDEIEFSSFPPSGLTSRQRSKSVEQDEYQFDDQITISKFTPTTENTVYLQNGSIIYGMFNGETLAFKGEYSLTIQKGAIRLFGSTLHASKNPYHIISPCNGTHSLPVIECVQVEDLDLVDVTTTRYNEHLFETYKAIVKIDSNPTGFQNIVRLAPPFKNLWGSSSDSIVDHTVDSTIPTSFDLIRKAPSSVALFTPFKSWYDIASKIIALGFENESPKVLVLGPKSSGKSSFCRFLTNFFLSSEIDHVHYLELDPGQPEYCLPGTISLHSPGYNFNPSFSHSNFRSIIKAHSLGSTSPKDQPSLYLSYCRDLYKTFEKTQVNTQTPLIINTPGWTRGLGVDLLADITSAMKPNVIISLGPEDSQAEVKSVLSYRTNVPITTVESVLVNSINGYPGTMSSSAAKYSASDLRILQTLTYFHTKATNDESTISFSPCHLTEMVPYVVPYGEGLSTNPLAIQGIAISAGEGIDIDDVFLCFNGSIVAIVSVDHETSPIPVERTPVESLPWIHPDNVSTVLIPETSRCLGYGVVQSIDHNTKSLRLLTPVSAEAISRNKQQKLVLVRGRLQLPLWELWNPALDETSAAPYLSKSGPGPGVGSNKWRVRRNVLRRAYA